MVQFSDTFQALSAAFTFGTVFQAASPAIILFTKGHGKTIFRDGRRLALVLFLLFAALWSQIEFAALMMPTTMSNLCAITVIGTTALDQLARVMLEQFLLWSVGRGTKLTKVRLALQGLLLLRIAAGGVLVGFTRIDYAPTCLAKTSQLPVGIVVLGLDGVIFAVLLIRAFSLGLVSGMRSTVSSEKQYCRALVFTIIGLGVWTGTSVPMIIGISGIILLLRTVLPANGLLLVASIIIGYSIALLVVKEEEGAATRATIESRSPPFENPMQPTREVFPQNSSNTGTPIIPTDYTRGSLFVVNPSLTPLSTPLFGGNGKSGDTKGFSKLNDNTTAMNVSPRLEVPNGQLFKGTPGHRGTDGYFVSMPNQQVVQDLLVPATRPDLSVNTQGLATANQSKRSIFGRAKTPPRPSVRTRGISQPMIGNADGTVSQSFANIPTIDLETAARLENERRGEAAARSAMTKTNGSTTSALLSPGRDELRRRSPGKGNGFGLTMDEKVPIQPTLSRSNTSGLPSNPRAHRGPASREIVMAKEQTVMRVNKIVYDQPGLVNDINDNIAMMYANRPKTAGALLFSETAGGLKSSGSIIHRPRPYKKIDTEKVQLFPSEPSRGLSLRRSKSSSSLMRQSSVSRSQPGSPSNLPELPPPPPTTAAKLAKLLPNEPGEDLNEKIEFLFPAPPGSKVQYRKSSVPSIPPVPAAFMVHTPASPWTEEDEGSRGSSKRTSQSSIESDQFDLVARTVANTPSRENRDSEILKDEPYLLGATTYQMESLTKSGVEVQPKLLSVPVRQLVIDDVRKSQFSEASFGDESLIDEAIDDWTSTNEKVPDIEISKVIENTQPTFSQRVKVLMEEKLDMIVSSRPSAQQAVSAESIPLMLETEDPHQSLLIHASANKGAFFLDDGLSSEESQPAPVRRSWHKRIGDELPTFLGRSKSTRKMPPPTPLLLNSGARKTAVVVRAEPSPPIDSPERALLEIQEQLKRFEDSNRGSVGSFLKRLPNANQELENSQDNERRRLLEDLEMEIGQQEDLRQQMHTDLDRDSILIATPQQIVFSEGNYQVPSQRVSKLMDRRSRIRSMIPELPQGNGTLTVDNSTSLWQQRLANAQMEYTNKATNPERKGSLNFLSVYKAPAGLESPTPPESVATDSESEFELDDASPKYAEEGHSVEENNPTEEGYSMEETQATPKKTSSLWQLPIASPVIAQGHLWRITQCKSVIDGSLEPPAMNIRPAQRHIVQSLQIFSVDTWTKPISAEHSRPVVGLWGSKLVRPKSIVTRPITQRPARRSRRTTLLPDIVESPVPLPNQQESLGLYQYPWGEKSDQAVYQPAFNSALAEPALNSQFDQRSRQLEPETYSSSYFDDYEDEDDTDVDDQDSEDEFDESTLFEIATLLKSNDVPSTQSLCLPRADEQALVSDCDSDDFSSEEDLAEMSSKEIIQISSPTHTLEELLQDSSSLGEILQPTTYMWSPPKILVEPYISGLFVKPTNTASIRNSEATPPAAINLLKAPRKSTVELRSLRSSSLWMPQKPLEQEVVWIMSENSAEAATPLKDMKSNSLQRSDSTPLKIMKPTQSSFMWYLPEKIVETAQFGLFDASAQRSSYRTTNATPAAISMVCKPRKSVSTLTILSSNKLWLNEQDRNAKRNWISESCTRQSTSSSETSASGSDTSSTKLARPKTPLSVPISEPMRAIVNKVVTSKIEGSKPTSRNSVLQDAQPTSVLPRQSLKPVTQNRESRMLASRAMFEAKASPAEKLPALTYRRQTLLKKPVKLTRQAMRQQHRPNGTFQSNWDEALREAEAASRTKPKMKKNVLSRFNQHVEEPVAPAKSPRFVKAIVFPVAESVVVEKMRVARPNVPSTKADWDIALEDAVSMSALPEVVQRYNSAVLHPVFFTETFTSAARDIHPAAIGHFSLKATAMNESSKALQTATHSSPKNISALWSSAIKATVTENTGTWIPTPNSVVRVPEVFATNMDSRNKAKSSSSEPLAKLNSYALFQPRASSTTSTHWLHSTSKTVAREIPAIYDTPEMPVTPLSLALSSISMLADTVSTPTAPAAFVPKPSKSLRSMTWTMPPKIATTENQTDLWNQPAKQVLSAPDMSATSSMVRIRAAAPQHSQLTHLVSTSLFAPPKPVSSAKDWLHSTSKSSPVIETPTPTILDTIVASTVPAVQITATRKCATTWKAPILAPLAPESSSSMWTVNPVISRSLPSPMLFGTMNTEPVTRTKRADSAVGRIESAELWKAGAKTTNEKRNWISGEAM